MYVVFVLLVGVLTLLAPQTVHAQVAWNANDWTSYDTITIDHTKVDDDITDYPVYVDLADLSSQFWSTTPSASTTVGTDIRVTNSSNTELPRELVFASSTAQTGELHFKADSISSTTDTVFKIWYNGTTTGDYATTSTYGAQNVWTDYNVVWHMNAAAQVDSSGNIPTNQLRGDYGDPSSFDSEGNIVMDANDEIKVTSGTEGSGASLGTYKSWTSIIAWKASSAYTGSYVQVSNGGYGQMNVDQVNESAGSARFGSGQKTITGSVKSTGVFQILAAVYDDNAGTVSAYSNGTFIGSQTSNAPSNSWDGWVTYRFVGSVYESRGASTTFPAAYLKAMYVNFSTTTDFYTAAAVVPGDLTLANHPSGQVSNTFSFMNETDQTLFAFQLSTSTEAVSVSNITFSLSNIDKFGTSDLANLRLYQDVNNNAQYDSGTDVQVGGAANFSVPGATGTIAFNGSFSVAGTKSYILVGDTVSIKSGAVVTFDLNPSNITATGSSTKASITPTGGVNSVVHGRSKAAGGGSISSTGGAPPPGAGTETGGSSDGGGGIDTNTGGGLIGNELGFEWPTAAGTGSWNNAANAYDQTDGTYATTTAAIAQEYRDHGFSVPGGNQVDGIEVKLEMSGTTAAGNISVDLSWDGGSSWTSAKTTVTLTTTDAVVSVGGPSDKWGRSWSPSDFSNTNFRVRLTGNPSSNEIRVDAIQVKVYHHTGGGGQGGGGGI